jgi:hypothetical protein
MQLSQGHLDCSQGAFLIKTPGLDGLNRPLTASFALPLDLRTELLLLALLLTLFAQHGFFDA